MALFGWFKKNPKDKKIQVAKRKQNALQDTAMAAAFAEAGEHETARSMIDRATGNQQILMLGREDTFSQNLISYALEMAKRLDVVELVALNVTTAPLTLADDKREEATALFNDNCTRNILSLKEQAENADITFTHVVEIGSQDEVVDKLHIQYPGMRYVLTEPDPEIARISQGRVSIPVFDLGSYQGASA